MTLHLTPEILERGYELLRATPPFKRWKLPHADNVELFVTMHRDRNGHFRGLDHRKPGPYEEPEIAVSLRNVKTCPELLAVLAHEMIHMRLDILKSPDYAHGPKFQRLAASVCRIHGFDQKVF